MSGQRSMIKALRKLKWRLTMAPILVTPDNFGGMKIYSDALSQRLGYVLIQNGRVIEFEFCP